MHRVCSEAIDAFRILSVYLKPVIPNIAAKVEQWLNLPPQKWNDIDIALAPAHALQPYQHLSRRVTQEDIDKLMTINQSLPKLS